MLLRSISTRVELCGCLGRFLGWRVVERIAGFCLRVEIVPVQRHLDERKRDDRERTLVIALHPAHGDAQRRLIPTKIEQSPHRRSARARAAEIVLRPRLARLRQVELGQRSWRTFLVMRTTTARHTCSRDVTRHTVPPVEKPSNIFPASRENLAELGVPAQRLAMPSFGNRAGAHD